MLVTHDPEVASRADRKIVLQDGMVVEDTLAVCCAGSQLHDSKARSENG